ncbi:MAG TPA: aromatic ring hydroxylase [Candidatus Magasanikbacteria bacterium]|nr:MAG: hypothetical protein A3I74_05105 [Candidatus Magasanikbacteria bacterium RIFCSPLOWO2_02_FULL_47_16]OGH79789.1 MAG: hypothetical protein A3C10_04255 [Candidatus Magasanikbacteria bacterium RIFCSPHIGHO2_02_FULL_48_18]OGH82576.1 MAG: hypothetical protein A3G08_03940 [Candidatus Magasanikbacteria bacterium RIFCSPLOWO2_12_FULL_47_9b]HAZ29120.1 aromatic ring hydroxylase [Candidatus Magasanikbacteria bacterium]
MIAKERIIEELETVMDPEIGIDVWTLGMIYGIDFSDEQKITITMTYTTPFCPYGSVLNEEVRQAVERLGFMSANVVITFDPPWKPPANLREMMGI